MPTKNKAAAKGKKAPVKKKVTRAKTVKKSASATRAKKTAKPKAMPAKAMSAVMKECAGAMPCGPCCCGG